MLISQKRITRTILACCALALSAFLLVLAIGPWPLSTVKAAVFQLIGNISDQTGYGLWHSGDWQATAAGGQNGLAAALNPDGSLRAGVSGSFNASGFRLEYSAAGAPRFVAAALACNGWDTQFAPPNGVDGTVSALAVNGMDIYVGGEFRAAGNIPAKNVAKFDTLTNTWSALGTGGGNGVDNVVFALVVSGSDLYVGGQFTTANLGGTTVSANRVAKFNTTTGVWSALGTGGGNAVNGIVFALAVSGSDLYVGGNFTTANVGGTTVSANRVARFNTTTGVWSALGTGGGNGVDTTVRALAVSGSDLYVGGEFTMANLGGTTVDANFVAKIDTTTGVWSALGTGGGNGVIFAGGAFSGVYALAVSGSDLYVGGNFNTANVDGTLVRANNIAKVNMLTGVWSKVATNVIGVDDVVFALAVSGSELYVGGVFTMAIVGGTRVSANFVAKFNTTTGVWSALGTGGGNGVGGAVEPIIDRHVFALAVSGSDLYVGGNFTMANVGGTRVIASGVAKVATATGAWSALGTGGNGVLGIIYALTVSGTDIYVGGVFDTAGNVAAKNVAKFDTLTNTWSALGTGGGNGVISTEGSNSAVVALAVSGSDLYVGGYFTTANVGGTTVSANNVAKVNTTTGVWSALGTGSGNGVSDAVLALAVSGSDLYVGGQFTTANVGGTTVSANFVAKFNTVTNTWSALGTGGGNGVDFYVQALAVSGSELYVGGDFTTANLGGATVSANNVAKVNTTTGVWSALGTGGGNGVGGVVGAIMDRHVLALAVSGSDLYVGGNFTTANVGGTTVSANFVAKVNTMTGVWSALGAGGGNGVNNAVRALALGGSDLYVGGNFTTTNVGGTTLSVNSVAKLNTTTGMWSALADTGGGNGVDGQVNALVLSGIDLFVSGQFTIVGDNKVSLNIGRFCGSSNSPPTISVVGVTRTEGADGSNSTIANVNDVEDTENTLAVTVNGVTTVTVNGVTISNVTVDAAGAVKANVVAACGASNASFTLNVTDSGGLMMTATLNVTVTANTPPALGNYPAATLAPGGSTTVMPSIPPSDNGAIGITASAPGFTGSFSVNPTTGVITISNAGPAGSYTVTVTATDDCGATAIKTFGLFVNCAGATITVTGTADGTLAALAGNGTCDLREAITAANTNAAVGECSAGVAGLDTIYFAIGTGTPTINVTGAALPTITEPVVIDGASCQSTRVELNGAGVAAAGTNGLTVTAGSTTIRGLVINRFRDHGISINTGGSNVIENCFIGTDASGALDRGNAKNGVFISASSNNRIGGTLSSQRNLISGNDQVGIEIVALPGSASNNVIQGNFIGTDVTGSQALGNFRDGIFLYGANASLNVIGGTTAGAGNLISSNGLQSSAGAGIALLSPGNRVLGNRIGTDINGSLPLGNYDGIRVGGDQNVIGGLAPGAANIIGNNTNRGVVVFTGTRNAILSNSIFSNSGLGIDLGFNSGVTANDPGDGDTGANNLQNFPVLAAVTNSGTITGALNSTAASSAYPVRIEFFANAACDASGNGEGETFLGSTTINTPGNFTANVTLIPGRPFITATATDNNGNTSEFAACIVVNVPPTITPAVVTRTAGSPSSNAKIADSVNALTVAVSGNGTTFGASATRNGVTISNLTLNALGVVRADVVAACGASTANFTLKVTGNAGAMTTASLNVTVNANTPPTLGNYPTTTINLLSSSSTTVFPSAPPSDNGTIVSLTVSASPGFTGSLNVNQVTGRVTITNAKPLGNHTITVKAVDNCGAIATSAFTLQVKPF